MSDLTMTLFERLGLLLILAFVLTRIPGFKSVIYRKYTVKMTFVHIVMFGLFGIAGTFMGLVFADGSILPYAFVSSVSDSQMVVSSSLVAIVIAGLLGGLL